MMTSPKEQERQQISDYDIQKQHTSIICQSRKQSGAEGAEG